MLLDNSGRLGIGTTSPAGKLAVSDGTVTGEINPFSSSSTCFIGTRSNHSVSFQINASEKARIDTSGRLGIGTTSPSQLLEINGSSSPCVLLKDTTNNVIAYTFADDSVANFGSASNHPVVFRVNNSEKARIDSSGRVGIGTTSPGCELEIGGNGHIHLADQGRVGCNSGSGNPEDAYIKFFDSNIVTIATGDVERMRIDSSGHITPGANGTQDLGSTSKRFANFYTSDLDLSNEAKGGNDVDGTWGAYTIQEGEEDLFLINKRSGKKYKFMLQEVS